MGRDDATATTGVIRRARRGLRLDLRLDEVDASLRDGRLVAHYQPIVRLDDGSVAAREALLRLRLPHGGLIGPERFLTTCEDSDLILSVGEWMLHEACHAASAWDGAGIAVNVSPRQLVGERLVRSVESALESSGLEPRRLCLELTESALLDGLPSAARTLTALRDIGARVAIDDFGVGHASIERLRHCPADVVKLDRSFVAGLDRDARDTAIVQLAAELAAAFGLDAVAEGVETAAQARSVADLGYAFAQGYYFAEPRPAPAAAAG